MPSPNFFSAGSPFLKHPLLTPERTTAEVTHILQQTKLCPPAAILDAGCGFGRHSIELARRGFEVSAIDSSPAMIETARRADAARNVEFQVVAAQDFQSDIQFHGAICLFTTLGQIDEHGDNAGLIPNIFALLRPLGCFVVEVPQRHVAVANMQTREVIAGPHAEAHITRSFDPATNVVTEQFVVVSSAEPEVFTLCYRLFDAVELQEMLEKSGFRVDSIHDGYTGQTYHSESYSILLFCTKPGTN